MRFEIQPRGKSNSASHGDARRPAAQDKPMLSRLEFGFCSNLKVQDNEVTVSAKTLMHQYMDKTGG